VVVSDPQGPGDFAIGTLAQGAGDTVQYDLPVTPNMATTNVATANGSGPNGALPAVTDPAVITVNLRPDPVLEIVKTALVGPAATCPAFDDGTADVGAAVSVVDGGVVTYCISVRNIGPGPATNVVVSDPQGPGDFAIGTLAQGAGDTVQYDLPVTPNMATTNVATANGSGPNGALPAVTDPAVITVQLRPDPVLEIVKTALRGPDAQCPLFIDGVQGPGDAVQLVETEFVTYCLTVLNSGLGDATNVEVTDTQAPDGTDLSIGDLPAGEQRTLKYDLEVFVTTPATNTAGVTGEGVNGPVEPDQDDAIINVALRPDPVLEIVKSVIPGPDGDCPDTFDETELGDGDALPVLYTETVTYCITVRNTGQGDATGVSVTDPAAPGVLQLGVIPAGQSAPTQSYDVVVDATTPALNTATVNGTGPNGVLEPDRDTALIDPQPQPDPVLEIVKTAIAGPLGDCPAFADGVPDEGTALPRLYTETVTFCISIRNTGPTTATSVMINDPQAPGPFDIGTLQPNQEETVTYDVIVDADTPATNVATATGVGPNGELPEATDPAVIDPQPQPEPKLEIVKTVIAGPDGDCPTFENGTPGQGEPLDVELFDTVTYCIAIRNVGGGDASNVMINDDQSPDSPYDIGVLAASTGTSVSYDLEVTADGSVINTAAATGTGPTGPIDQVEDDAIINVTDSRVANITLIHSVSVRGEDCVTATKDLNSLVANIVGTEVTWCAEITNGGNVPLTNIVLDAPQIGVTGIDALEAANAGSVLLPGESVTISLDGVIVPDGLLSDGSVVAQPSDADGNPVDLPKVDDADTAETREASIDLQTTVVAGVDGDCAEATEIVTVQVGDDVTWCFLVTNTGTVDLLVEEVTDVTLGVTVEIPVDEQRLSPGDTVLVTNGSQATGDLVNDAEVVGQPLDVDGTVLDQAPVVQDSDPAQINTPTADLAIDKAVSDNGPVPANTTLTYTLSVTQNGPDTAEDVSITDSLPDGLDYITLPVNDDWTCAFDGDRRGFSCDKNTDMEADTTVDLVYEVLVSTAAVQGVGLVNTATVDSSTPDPDETNNEDSETTELIRRQDAPPTRELPEYPGPFTPPPAIDPPDEVLGLAITGAQSRLLGLLSAALLAVGGTMLVGSRRRKEGQA